VSGNPASNKSTLVTLSHLHYSSITNLASLKSCTAQQGLPWLPRCMLLPALSVACLCFPAGPEAGYALVDDKGQVILAALGSSVVAGARPCPQSYYW
jgi:hypothetical protein